MALDLKRIAGVSALAIFMSVVTPALAATTIQVVPGPDGNPKVITPWGDYVVLYEGDRVWVGTEDEYMHAKATTVFRDSGAREMVIQGAKKNEYTYISAALPSTSVGKTNIGGLNVGALFRAHEGSAPKRPKRSDKSEYVQIFWTQSNRADVRMTLSDDDTKRTIDPYKCANAFDTSYYCEFIVDRTNLADRMSIIATSAGQAPGIIPLKSIANAQYIGIVSSHKMMPAGSPLNADEQADLKELARIDPAIPATLP